MQTYISTRGKMSIFAVCSLLLMCLVANTVMCHQVPSSEPYASSHHFDPYSYGYETEDTYGNKQWRQERSSHPHEVHGSYGYKDKNGVYREVTYTADSNGFRANIKTNEPGVSGASDKSPANTKIDSYYSAPTQPSAPATTHQHYSSPPPPPPSASAHQHYAPPSYPHAQTAASPPIYTRQHYASSPSYAYHRRA